MSQLNPIELMDLLEAKPDCKIAIFNFGENVGQDLSYFCHYHALRKLFPNITLDLFRTNVDETNCIGFEKYADYVASTPLNNIRMAVVKQRYGSDWRNTQDWTQKLDAGEKILPPEFYDTDQYDLYWGEGRGNIDSWYRQIPHKPSFTGRTLKQTIEFLLKKYPERRLIFSSKNAAASDPGVDGAGGTQFAGAADAAVLWDRTGLEYLSYQNPEYPFIWKPEIKTHPLATNYRDYLRVSLRWPDYVRWYYGIDKQFDVVNAIIAKIGAAGKPVKLIYNIKDGEIGNNFERGQTLDRLQSVRNACMATGGDIVFTYSWTQNPFFMRPTEAQERAKLRSIGVPEDKIIRLNFWEELIHSSSCKVWLSDPGGFAEIVSMLRPAESSFLFPVSLHHAGTYLTMDEDKKILRTKINPLCIKQCYNCSPEVVGPDASGPRRTKCWKVRFGDDEQKIGEDCHGDDFKYFEAAQNTVYKKWFERTAPDLINGVVAQYLK